MSVDALTQITAFRRFGLGPRPNDLEKLTDPRGALLAEFDTPDIALIDDGTLQRTPALIQATFADEDLKKKQREANIRDKLASIAMPEPGVAAKMFDPPTNMDMSGGNMSNGNMSGASMGAANMTGTNMMPGTKPADNKPPQSPEQIAFRAEVIARLAKACTAPIGFAERWVAFWSNHFSISVAKSNVGRATAGAFEREAIRPFITGRFVEMLRAVEQHPTMLNFLDNAQSIGPNSKAGKNRKQGLNENLAREILELHTMGVGSGYTQTDVTQLARIITGWSYAGREGKLGEPGSFIFNANAHEPGIVTLRGRTYAQGGAAQGLAALDDIAAEPAVANHIALKVARHFVADSPDPALVTRLATAFRQSNGDLGVLARTLIKDDVAWAAPATKIRNPWEFTVATYRALNRPTADPGPALNALNLLGQPLWQPGGPNGFPDDSRFWASPEGLKMRLQLSAQVAHQYKEATLPARLMDQILGPSASVQTREAILRAESREQAIALLLMSPEFQRR